MTSLQVFPSELILGGQKSGKSRRAEQIASSWLHQNTAHQVVFIVTAQPGDKEMLERIARHRADRAKHLPQAKTVEVALDLAQVLVQYSHPQTLVVVDCLTLWLTNVLMPIGDAQPVNTDVIAPLSGVISTMPGPVVLVSNEIGLGVIPMGAQVRVFVDTLGKLNQTVAAVCQRVTLMAAGLALPLKEAA